MLETQRTYEWNRKSGLTRRTNRFEAKSRRSATPRRSLRLESLEDRRLLSVSAAEYESLRSTYSEFDLPAEVSSLTVTELAGDELTQSNLQAAVDRAATTPQSDLILLRTTDTSDTLTLNGEPVVVNVDSSQNGDVLILTLPEDPVAITANNQGGVATFEVVSGNLRLGGLNLTEIDTSDTANIQTQFIVATSLAVDSATASLNSENVHLYDTNGVDITELDVSELELARMKQEIEQAEKTITTSNDVIANGTTTEDTGDESSETLLSSDENAVAQAANTADNYVVLFSGGYNAANNRSYYYLELVRLYNICVTQYDIPAENIYVIYADGLSTGNDMRPYSSTAVAYANTYENSDMSFASGSTVLSATLANLNTVTTILSGKMDSNDHLLFFSYDHGAGTANSAADKSDYVYGWGSKISGSAIAASLHKLTTGYVTTVHTQCFSGGILDDVQNSQTGVVSSTAVNGAWYGISATNHYEVSWTSCYADMNGRFLGTAYGFSKTFADAIDKNVGNKTSTSDIFNYAKSTCNYTASGTWANNGGTWVNGFIIHPWAVGSEFTLFANGDSDGYDLTTSDGGELSTSEVTVGESVSVTVKTSDVANVGTEASTEYSVQFRYTTDGTTWTEFGSPVVGKALNVGDSTTFSATFDTTMFSVGTYTIGWVVTANGEVVTMDNEAVCTTTLVVNPVPVVDLNGESLVFGAQTYEEGQDVAVTYTYTNSGTIASTSFDCEIYLNDILMATVPMESLAAGATGTGTYDFGTLPVGTYTVRMVLDSANGVVESDETNNELTGSFTVIEQQVADLAMVVPEGWIDSICFNSVSTTPSDGIDFSTEDKLYVWYAFQNAGNVAITEPYTVKIYLDKTCVRTLSMTSALGAGDVVSGRTAIGSLPADTYTIRVVLDVGGTIVEGDETNNVYTRALTITDHAGEVDLTAATPEGWSGPIVISTNRSTYSTQTEFSTQDSLYVRYAFMNAGGADVGNLFVAELSLDTIRLTQVRLSTLVAGELRISSTALGIGSLPIGTYTLKLSLDTTDNVLESDELNNVYTTTFTIYDPNGDVDLCPAAPEGWSAPIVVSTDKSTNCERTEFYTDETIYVQYAFMNAGGADLGNLCANMLYLDGQRVAMVRISTLTAGTFRVSSTAYNAGQLAAGTYTLQLVVDGTEKVIEGDETNNEYTMTFTVVERPVEPVVEETNAVDEVFSQADDELTQTFGVVAVESNDVDEIAANEVATNGNENAMADKKLRNESLDYLYATIGDEDEVNESSKLL